MTTIGQRIREKRLQRKPKKLTQQQLADIVGVSREAVSQWESGDTKALKPEHLLSVADALQIDIRWLVTGKVHRYRQIEQHDIQENIPVYTEDKMEALQLITTMPDTFATLVLPLLRYYAENWGKKHLNAA